MLDKTPFKKNVACLLIGTDPDKTHLNHSIGELIQLCHTANIQPEHQLTQIRDNPHPLSYLGKGKIEEINIYIQTHCIELLIANDELTPKQAKHLETELNIKIIDRTTLILDIFASRATTKEAQLQVELAQLQYLFPRLTRMWTHLSRLGGGIGTRGPGEKQLEVDKRQVRKRMLKIEEKIKKFTQDRSLRRESRTKKASINFALVGYTNAGKSSVLHRLTECNPLIEDQLFATLDPLSKAMTLANNETIILTDTVGFIEKLPHTLIKAFRSTLEETIYADFHLHVVDLSDPRVNQKIEIVNSLLKELNASEIPKLFIFNKLDLVDNLTEQKKALNLDIPHVIISVKKNTNIQGLIDAITNLVNATRQIKTFQIPASRADILHLLHEHSHIQKEDFEDNTYLITTQIDPVMANKILSKLNQ